MLKQCGFGAVRSLGYVIILCDDFDLMKEFYAGLFDFQVEDEQAGLWMGFRVGSLFLGLRPRGRSYDGPKTAGSSASVQLSFQVPPADVDLAYDTLVDRGIDVIEGPANQDWNHRTLFFTDPENNIIEIYADIHPDDTSPEPSGVHKLMR